jgi:hypothetical protein
MGAYTGKGALRVDAQATDAVAITKSDTTVLSDVRGVYVGGAGDVAVITGDAWRRQLELGVAAVAVTFTGVPAGSILPVHVAKVMSTNTTASALVGLL